MTVTQTEFRAALFDPSSDVPEGLCDGQGRPAGRRYNVYRNNVAVSLTEALHESFPAIARLLGKQNMDGVASVYLRQSPPSSPILAQYGEDFGDFLDAMPQLEHMPYLGDVARLEWLLRAAYHASDSTSIAPEALAALPPEAFDNARLILAPSLSLLQSRWPVLDIWTYATEDGAPKPGGTAQDVLILRRGYDPEAHLIGSGAAAFLASVTSGAPLNRALEHATAKDPAFDLAALLGLLLGTGAIQDIQTGAMT